MLQENFAEPQTKQIDNLPLSNILLLHADVPTAEALSPCYNTLDATIYTRDLLLPCLFLTLLNLSKVPPCCGI